MMSNPDTLLYISIGVLCLSGVFAVGLCIGMVRHVADSRSAGIREVKP